MILQKMEEGVVKVEPCVKGPVQSYIYSHSCQFEDINKVQITSEV